jgi:hypothetical protein
LGWSETGGLVHRCSELDVSALLWGGTEVWGVLRTGRHVVIEAEVCFCHIVGHADVDGAVGIVPIEIQTNVEVAGPVNGEGVLALEYFKDMARMILSDVLDAKIVNDEAD